MQTSNNSFILQKHALGLTDINEKTIKITIQNHDEDTGSSYYPLIEKLLDNTNLTRSEILELRSNLITLQDEYYNEIHILNLISKLGKLTNNQADRVNRSSINRQNNPLKTNYNVGSGKLKRSKKYRKKYRKNSKKKNSKKKNSKKKKF